METSSTYNNSSYQNQYKNDTLIDNIFTNQLNPDILSGNLTVGISDHIDYS